MAIRARALLTTVAISAAVVPLAVLAHEFGHLIGYWMFRLPSPVLHYAASGFAGDSDFWTLVRAGEVAQAARIANPSHAGWSALFGLLVSYALVSAGLWGVARFKSRVMLAVVLSSAARFPLVLLLFVLGRAEHTDEAHVAQAFGQPVPLPWIGGALLVAALGGAAAVSVRSGRTPEFFASLAGVILGILAWVGFVGPRLLP